jgi:hypothetical protein
MVIGKIFWLMDGSLSRRSQQEWGLDKSRRAD